MTRNRILLTVVGVVGAGLLGVFLARAALLESLLKFYLARSGDQAVELEVLRVGLDRTTLANIKSKWLRAGRITARYSLPDLVNARLALIEVDELSLDLDLTARGAGPGFELPSVPPIALSQAAISAKTPLGSLEIRAEGRTEPGDQGELRADLDLRGSSQFGAFEGRLQGVVGSEGLQALDLGLQAPALLLPGMALGQTALGLELEDAQWSARAVTRTTDGGAEIEVRGGATGVEALRNIAVDLEARMDWKAGFLRELVPGPIDAEEIRVELSMTAAGPPPDTLPSTSSGWVTALASAGLMGAVTIDIQELRHPSSRHLVSSGLRVTVASDADGLMLTLPEKVAVSAKADRNATAEAQQPEFDWLQLLGEAPMLALHGPDKAVPLDLQLRATRDGGMVLAYDGTARLSATQGKQMWFAARGEVLIAPGFDELRFQSDQASVGLQGIEIPGLEIEKARFEGSVSGDGQSLKARGRFDFATPEFRLGDLSFKQTRFSAPIETVIEDGGLRLSSTKAGRLQWRRAEVQPGIVRMPDDFSLTVSAAALQADAKRIAYEARFEPEQFTLLFAAEPRPIDLDLRPRPVTIKGGWIQDEGHQAEVDFGFDRLDLPGYGITAVDLQGREVFSPNRSQELLTLSVAEVRSSQSPVLFAPFSLDATIDHAGTDIRAAAEGRTPAGRPFFGLRALHSRLTGAGSASLSLDPPLAGAEGLALDAIVPAAGDLVLSGGQITATADLAWTDDKLDGRASLGLNEVSLVSEQVSIEGLDGRIVLESLFPPKSEAVQRVTAKRFDLGRRLEDLEMTFLVAPVGSSDDVGLTIVEATGDSAFGSLAIEAGTVIPNRKVFDLPIRIIDLDLAALSAWASIEGLEVTGYLSGLVPLRIEDETVSLADAALSNTVEGRIAFRSETAARALAGGGEPVDLMLSALENFEYQRLKLTANTVAEEDRIELLVSTLGSNPDVLEGHPFQFNIRLTGKLTQLLGVLGQGGEVASGVLERMWRLKP